VLLQPRVELLIVESKCRDLFEIFSLLAGEFCFCRICRRSRGEERSFESFNLGLEFADSTSVALIEFFLKFLPFTLQPRDRRFCMFEILRHVIESFLSAEGSDDLGDA